MDKSFAYARTFIINTALIGSTFLQQQIYVFKVDMVHLVLCIPAYKNTVLAGTLDICEINTARG